MVPFSFAGHDVAIMAEGALFWPARHALIVADLHLEKASWFAARGQMLPPYDSIATLSALGVLVARTAPREIWCLGDSFHDGDGPCRLPEHAAAMLREFTGRCNWAWITGNHDAGLAEPFGGRVMTEAVVDGIVLRHEAEPDEARPELSGHFHPKLRVTVGGRRIARRCFVATPTKLVLPAFGALTGGLDADHPEILRAVGGEASALVATGHRLLQFRLAA